MKTFTDRQKQIIDVSINIIAKKGIQHLTIKNISKDLGISEPAIYRHFEGKIDILLAIISFFKKNAERVLQNMNDSKLTSREQIETIFSNHFKEFAANPAMAAVIFSEEIFQNDKRLSDEVKQIMEMNQKMINKIIKKGQENNDIRNDIPKEHLSVIIMGALRFIVIKWRLSNYTFNLELEGKILWKSLRKII